MTFRFNALPVAAFSVNAALDVTSGTVNDVTMEAVELTVRLPVMSVVPPAGTMDKNPDAVIRLGALTDVVKAAVLLPVNAPVTATVPPVLVSDRLPDAVVTVGVITDVLADSEPVTATVPPAGVSARLPLAVSIVGVRTFVLAVNCTSVKIPLLSVFRMAAAAPGLADGVRMPSVLVLLNPTMSSADPVAVWSLLLVILCDRAW